MMANEKETTAEAPAEAPAPKTEEAAGEPAAPVDEAAEIKDRLLRTLAEMENLRRRTEREMADARQYAVANFAREMLAVGDNLRRAIEAVPKELRDGGDKALAALIEGVEATERGLQQSLMKFGVRRVEARGQKFDPSVHQALFEVETAEAEAGTVAEEIQAGYVIGERVLRPALVAIAKKTKPAPSAANADEAGVEAAADPPAESAAPQTAEAQSSTDQNS
jgi:molecular chaperone GrpE